MKQPIWQPRDRQISERRHYDSPTLWYTFILGSVAIHLSGLGLLGWLLNSGLIDTASARKLIPIDVVAIAPNTTSTTQVAPKTVLTPTQKKTTTKTKNNPTPKSPTTSPKSIKSQPGVTKQPISTTKKKSPASNSSKSSVRVQPQTKPTPTGNNNPSGTKTPNSSPPSIGSSPGKTLPPQSGGGIIASPGKLVLISKADILHPGDPNRNDEPAILLDSSKQLSSEALKHLGISLQRDVELKVGIIVETDGTAGVLPFQVVVVRGSLSQDKAVALAREIISQWQFKPTKMAGSPTLGNYSLPLTIRPAPK
jgi:outer membrane biosynthesis protein TonB